MHKLRPTLMQQNSGLSDIGNGSTTANVVNLESNLQKWLGQKEEQLPSMRYIVEHTAQYLQTLAAADERSYRTRAQLREVFAPQKPEHAVLPNYRSSMPAALLPYLI
jgi:hypothetical protein